MMTRCGRCHKWASTERECKNCGSSSPMLHVHECDLHHYISYSSPEERRANGVEPPKDGHYIDECPHVHVHPHKDYHEHTETGSITIPAVARPTRAQRMQYLLSLPWISPVRGKHVPCEGWKAGKGRGGCKNAAKFRYRALKRAMYAQSGKYCWSHLPLDCPDEHDRLLRYMDKNPPPWREGSN